MHWDDKLPGCKYFKVYEVGKSHIASRKGIDNQPSLEVLLKAAKLAVNCLDPMREQYGPFSPQSWYRSEPLEKEITWYSVTRVDIGFPGWCRRRGLIANEHNWTKYFARKTHPTGGAADIEIAGVSNDTLFEWCKDNLEFDQLIREFPGTHPMSGWVHISYNQDSNRNEVLTIP